MDTVSFRLILKNWRLRVGEFVALVRAIVANEIRPTSLVPAPLGEIELDADQLHAWLRDFRLAADDWLSVDQAARILDVKQQVAYELVARGLLHSTQTTSSVRQVSAHDLRAFMATYVSLAELARARQHSPRWLLNDLTATPVTGPSVDGARQYFYRRVDIPAPPCSVSTGPTAPIPIRGNTAYAVHFSQEIG